MKDQPEVEPDRTPEKVMAIDPIEPSTLYCICKQPETADMIGCDDCENWFHPKCLEKLGIDVSQIQNIAEFPFSCKECIKKKK